MLILYTFAISFVQHLKHLKKHFKKRFQRLLKIYKIHIYYIKFSIYQEASILFLSIFSYKMYYLLLYYRHLNDVVTSLVVKYLSWIPLSSRSTKSFLYQSKNNHEFVLLISLTACICPLKLVSTVFSVWCNMYG